MRLLSKNRSKFFSKILLKRWMSVKREQNEFHGDEEEVSGSETDDEEQMDMALERRHSCSENEATFPRRSFGGQPARHSSAVLMPKDSEILKSKLTERQHFRIFVGTWNVGGRTPNEKMNIEEWLGLGEPADIYVVGFQEIVPLNAGNVLGAENNSPAVRWLHLIRDTLNNAISSCNMPAFSWHDITEVADTLTVIDAETGEPTWRGNSFPKRECHMMDSRCGKQEETLCNDSFRRMEFTSGAEALANDEIDMQARAPPPTPLLSPNSSTKSLLNWSNRNKSHYVLVASKQMVGIFLSVWARRDLSRHIHNIKVSCVGCGLMGYLGNKGSISISMCLHQTTFCFICSHLASGERGGDEFRRNSDVSDILKRTQFRRSNDLTGMVLPETILEHDRIIWFGDLNYRLALSSNVTMSLLARQDWKALLEKDQLHREQMAGRVFVGWHEGRIYFAPTYKYMTNSDQYTSEKAKIGGKQRTPAWCDRILWHGKGIKQLAYIRVESKFSDHRPVCAVFLAEVEALSRRKLKEILGIAKVES